MSERCRNFGAELSNDTRALGDAYWLQQACKCLATNRLTQISSVECYQVANGLLIQVASNLQTPRRWAVRVKQCFDEYSPGLDTLLLDECDCGIT